MSQKQVILIIEDDEKLSNLIQTYLQSKDFEVIQAFSGDQGITRAIKHQPDLIILDIMLPNINGLDVCRSIREVYSGKILMLTATEDDETEITGLTLGADEFLHKPINPELLLIRINRLLKQENSITVKTVKAFQQQGERYIILGQLKLDCSKYEVFFEGKQLELSLTVFKLLHYFVTHQDVLISRDELFQYVKGIEYNGIDRFIDNKVAFLRKELKDDLKMPYKIKTVWGKGYIFCSDVW